MVDPILQILYQGGGILARRIVNQYLANANNIEQEIAIEILERGFRSGSNHAWNTVRTNMIQRLRNVLHPRIGPERTTVLLNGIEVQINRVARENNIEIDQTGWLTASEQNAADQVPEHLRQDAIRNAPLELTPQQLEVQRRHREHYERANEYGERQEMEHEDEQSMHQQQRDISNEIFTGRLITQFAQWTTHLIKLREQMIIRQRLKWLEPEIWQETSTEYQKKHRLQIHQALLMDSNKRTQLSVAI
jgi:hypothetical protein